MATSTDAPRPFGVWLRRLVTLAAVGAVLPLMSGCNPAGGDSGSGGGIFGPKPVAGSACPRPAIVQIGAPPQFNAQEQEIRLLRRQAFHGDFFAQIDLARRYTGRDARSHNLEDPVEAAVWYEMALANPDGFAPTIGADTRSKGGGRLNDCRTSERRNAYQALELQLGRMSSDERQEVRDRVIYVLSTQGSPGFRTLARLHDVAFGPFGDPMQATPKPNNSKNPVLVPASTTLFTRNDVDVYLYNYLAAQAGDVAGYVMMKEFEGSAPDRAAMVTEVEAKAKRWVPPFEFYPPEATESGVPHSDESDSQGGDASNVALGRIDELPFQHVAEALAYLQVIPRPVKSERFLSETEVKTFQVMLGRPATGYLTALEKVRAIQYAAVNGSPKAQLALAVMYADGIGVPSDYARSFHWFQEAERQGSAEAKYAMSSYFSLGVDGVADQDKAQAVVYQIDGALAGFKPSVQRLRELLAQVAPKGGARRPGYGPGPQRYPEGPSGDYGPPPNYPAGAAAGPQTYPQGNDR